MHRARAHTHSSTCACAHYGRPSVERLHVHTTAGTLWNVYPMYDYAHALTDAIEGVTHSLCTLEFENHRELYDWVVRECAVPCTPRQIEFSRLNLQYTVRSCVDMYAEWQPCLRTGRAAAQGRSSSLPHGMARHSGYTRLGLTYRTYRMPWHHRCSQSVA